MPAARNICFLASDAPIAAEAQARLAARFGHYPPEEADVIVALGGDGFMLSTLHGTQEIEAPVYGMNRGTVGFLMNEFREMDLPERIAEAQTVQLHPLQMEAHTMQGESMCALAINEVSLLRETRQAAKLRIKIDGVERLAELVCDGALVCTPAGSTAYNLSAHGPILPMGSGLMALTPISPFRPRRWRGALLPHGAEVVFDVQDPQKRPVSAVADYTEVRDVSRVIIREDSNMKIKLLFDPEHNLEERILKEQFVE
ncbi:NAD kinase [Thalassospira sp.]|uniref:NAD kinase n=1 Tax=Thalassospira sp. TaxID=1912094 RepID=UPI00257D3903|nr:NAD kinase [Thalassospira sp.]